jgi:hypothetical protein
MWHKRARAARDASVDRPASRTRLQEVVRKLEVEDRGITGLLGILSGFYFPYLSNCANL